MSFRGALVKKSVDQTGANYSNTSGILGAILSWDAEGYDTDGFHSGGDPTKIIVPSQFNNKYGRLNLCVSIDASSMGLTQHGADIYKNGSVVYPGTATTRRKLTANGQGANASWLQISTGPILLASADEFTSAFFDEDSSITIKAESAFSIEILTRKNTHRVLAKKAADQTSANYSTPTAIAWDGTDVYDTDSLHDPSSSNTKIIVPAGLNGLYAVAVAQVTCGGSTVTNGSASALAIRKNNSLTYNGFGGQTLVSSVSSCWTNARTHPFQLTTGDEIEGLYYNSDSSITVLATQSSLGLYVVG